LRMGGMERMNKVDERKWMKGEWKWHRERDVHGNTLSVDSSQVGVLEQGDEVRLRSFLERHDGGGLEAEIGLHGQLVSSYEQVNRQRRTYLEVLGDFTDEALEGELADKQLRRLLVPSDFTKGDGSGPEPMGLLHTTSGSL
jgi:hypothetical protein